MPDRLADAIEAIRTDLAGIRDRLEAIEVHEDRAGAAGRCRAVDSGQHRWINHKTRED